nr:retrovirus-related Pol polyprotein from transposon TNT 1-94 [Tanacetum cinerariifolium]
VVRRVSAGVAAAVGVSGGHGGGGAAVAAMVGTQQWWLRGLEVGGVVGGGGSGGCYCGACRRWVADLIDRDTRRHFLGSPENNFDGGRGGGRRRPAGGRRTEYQLADIFTKPLAQERLEFLIKKLGMQSMSLETLKKLADEDEE